MLVVVGVLILAGLMGVERWERLRQRRVKYVGIVLLCLLLFLRLRMKRAFDALYFFFDTHVLMHVTKMHPLPLLDVYFPQSACSRIVDMVANSMEMHACTTPRIDHSEHTYSPLSQRSLKAHTLAGCTCFESGTHLSRRLKKRDCLTYVKSRFSHSTISPL